MSEPTISKHLQSKVQYLQDQKDANRAKAAYMRSKGIQWPPPKYRNKFTVEWPTQPDRK